MNYKKLIILIMTTVAQIGLCFTTGHSEPLGELTVEKIMRDQIWMGSFPKTVFWSEDSKTLYFEWNPEGLESDSLYFVPGRGGVPRKVPHDIRVNLPARGGDYNRDYSMKVYEKNGDIYLLDVSRNHIRQLTNTLEWESDPCFCLDDDLISYCRNDNLYLWDLKLDKITQLTNFSDDKPESHSSNGKSESEQYIESEQLRLFETLRKRKSARDHEKEAREAERPSRPAAIALKKRSVNDLMLSPNGLFATFNLVTDPPHVHHTSVPEYVTESGFTEEKRSYARVGRPDAKYEFGIFDIKKDTAYFVSMDSIDGMFDKPAYLSDYASDEDSAAVDSAPTPREVYINSPIYSDDGKLAVVVARAFDRKDRWIMLLDLPSGRLSLLDRQHDDAWIGGPGIGGYLRSGDIGWLADNRRIWFQSEESGFSHIYTVDVTSGEKKQITSGNFEIDDTGLSRDKKYWYFIANDQHPGLQQFYRLPTSGGRMEPLTSFEGGIRAYLSPDESRLALLYSSPNRPPQLYLQENRPGAEAVRVTHSISDEFLSYPWRVPEVITFEARDGVTVYARLYRPSEPREGGPGAIFVHGAGYLQNAHKRWSWYSHEYMFNNLLADRGYTVLDIDYRGSAGYGRDCRTGIYRHMGGKDLDDNVDGARLLVEEYGVDAARIGIYGGSYGGYITFMALFTEPDVFAAGAALRPVADFAQYNHGYTVNILNTPQTDSIAYYRSAPINFAEGLKNPLLICHGLIDDNTHFQDVARVIQRLIELGKDNFELALYPLERHSFREACSWTDEYGRILKLFEENLE